MGAPRKRAGTTAAVIACSAFALSPVNLRAAEGRPVPVELTPAARAAALRAHGMELGYNLDREEALQAFQEAARIDRSHPAAHRLMAAHAWMTLLFEQGAVTAEDFLGQAKPDRRVKPPNPQLASLFHDSVGRALTLAQENVRTAESDADAHYQLGATYGFLASYAATVDGGWWDSLRSARRAYDEHERVMKLDARRKDAGLIVGMYRYAVSVLSLPSRLIAHLAGFGGGRERGLRMVEDAAQYPSEIQTNALFALIVIYNREGRYDDALRVIGQLHGMYPRNRLLRLEAGSTALRAGRAAQARQTLEEGIARLADDPRPRAFGEQARWHYYHGAALAALGEVGAARHALDAALTSAGRDWVRGRVHLELGKLADLAGDKARAVAEYRQAARLCGGDNDPTCMNEATKLIKAEGR